MCDVANDNGGAQVVVSGHKSAVERAVAIAPGKGAKRAVMLTVSAPFHCALMRPAADAMREALAGVAVEAPAVPVVANVEAAPITDPAAIRDALVRQVTGTVRWRASVAWMAAGRGRRVRRGRVGQGPDRARQADRRRRDGDGNRHAGRYRRLPSMMPNIMLDFLESVTFMQFDRSDQNVS